MIAFDLTSNRSELQSLQELVETTSNEERLEIEREYFDALFDVCFDDKLVETVKALENVKEGEADAESLFEEESDAEMAEFERLKKDLAKDGYEFISRLHEYDDELVKSCRKVVLFIFGDGDIPLETARDAYQHLQATDDSFEFELTGDVDPEHCEPDVLFGISLPEN